MTNCFAECQENYFLDKGGLVGACAVYIAIRWDREGKRGKEEEG